MTEIISSILPYIPENAFALVICVCFYIYINYKRKNTKQERDEDSKKIHDELLKHSFEINNLKNADVHKDTLLDDIRSQISTMNVEIAKLAVSIDNLTKLLEKK